MLDYLGRELVPIWVAFLRVSPGVPVVLAVAVVAWFMAALFAAALESLRHVAVWPVPQLATAIILTLRGVPELVLLFIIFYGLSNVIRLSAFFSAVLALATIQAPFVAEVYRAAILTVPKSQRLAAMSIGLGPINTVRLVVIPQAVRFALLPMGNILLGLTKLASVTSAVGIPEVTKLGLDAMEDNANQLPAVTLAICIAYLALTLPMSQGLRLLAKYSRGRRLRG